MVVEWLIVESLVAVCRAVERLFSSAFGTRISRDVWRVYRID